MYEKISDLLGKVIWFGVASGAAVGFGLPLLVLGLESADIVVITISIILIFLGGIWAKILDGLVKEIKIVLQK